MRGEREGGGGGQKKPTQGDGDGGERLNVVLMAKVMGPYTREMGVFRLEIGGDLPHAGGERDEEH